MNKLKVAVQIKDGKIIDEGWSNVIKNLFDGPYLISFKSMSPQSGVDTYMRLYFLKVDTIAKEVGETRYDVHELAKEYVLADLLDNNPDFMHNNGAKRAVSTTRLTEEGWLAYLDALDIWAFVNYNIILN